MYWMQWQNMLSNSWTRCSACLQSQTKKIWLEPSSSNCLRDCSHVACFCVKSLQKQEHQPHSIIILTQPMQQRSLSMKHSQHLCVTASLQYLHSSFPEAPHPGDDSSRKPLARPSMDIIYIIHIHKSMRTNFLWDARVSIKPWTWKNTCWTAYRRKKFTSSMTFRAYWRVWCAQPVLN